MNYKGTESKKKEDKRPLQRKREEPKNKFARVTPNNIKLTDKMIESDLKKQKLNNSSDDDSL